MKSVLLSLHPKWCELIAGGKKTVEVRKTRPKIDTPFKCYIYATKPKTRSHPARIYNSYIMPESGKCGSGKVIGEFMCDKIDRIEIRHFSECGHFNAYCSVSENPNNQWRKQSCLTEREITEYGKLAPIFAWNISDLKIYDEPKELSEFWTIKCTNKKGSCADCAIKPKCINHLNRPPQSWRYVEDGK